MFMLLVFLYSMYISNVYMHLFKSKSESQSGN